MPDEKKPDDNKQAAKSAKPPSKLAPAPRPSGSGWGGRLPWILLLGVVLLLIGLTVFFRGHMEAETSQRQQAEAQADSFRRQMDSLRSQLTELQTEMEALAESGNESAEAALRRQRDLDRARQQQAQSEQKYSTALEEAESQRDELAGKLSSMEGEMDVLRKELADARAIQGELRERLEQAQRLSDALQTKLKGKEDALSALERSYQSFKDNSGAASRQLELMTKTVTELQVLNERRARQMEQAMRRMRELSENYRTVAVRIDSDPRTQGTLNAEVNRLQSSVLAVEDHMAQISTLNTQASALEQRLARARSGVD
jgi:chromosome segregation ATPase